MSKAKTTGTGKYEKLLAVCSKLSPVTAAAYPCEESALTAAIEAAQDKLIQPILVGPADQGDILMLSLVMANRDPSLFENPGEINFHRDNLGKTLTFGHGITYCTGAPSPNKLSSVCTPICWINCRAIRNSCGTK